MKNVIMLRSNAIDPDPRLEKEASALLDAGYSVKILGWDREQQYNSTYSKSIGGKNVEVTLARFKATFGGGLKNLLSLLCFQFWVFFKLLKARKEFDVLHAADFDTILPCFAMKLMFKEKKIIYDIYDFYVDAFTVPNCLKSIVRNLDFLAIKHSDAVIIATEQRKEQISGATPKKLVIIHNTPIESEIFKDSKNIFDENKNGRLKIVYVGILQEHRFLKEMSDVVIKKPEIDLFIGGFGALSSYFYDLSEKHKNIHFFGRVDYERSLQLSYSADVMVAVYDPVIPNHKFSAPNKFYEALMLGKPLIVSKNTGVDDAVSKLDLGVVIEYNKSSFEDAIVNFDRDKFLSKKFKLYSNKIYSDSYSWKVMSERLVETYADLFK
jgi:glycosyltransferase involved in cell wall biosynthesis